MKPAAKTVSLVRFVAITLVATGLLHGALAASGRGLTLSFAEPVFFLYLAGLAMPSLVALWLVGAGGRRDFLRAAFAHRGSRGLYFAAASAQVGILLLAWLLAVATRAPVRPAPSLPPGFLLLAVGQIWVVCGEELGWRGFALPRLESMFSPRIATVVLASLWGAWHTPMFFVAGSMQARESPWVFASAILAWSAIHTFLYQRARPSVLPNLVFHACANLTLNTGLAPLQLGPYLMISYLLVAAVALRALRPKRRNEEVPEDS